MNGSGSDFSSSNRTGVLEGNQGNEVLLPLFLKGSLQYA